MLGEDLAEVCEAEIGDARVGSRRPAVLIEGRRGLLDDWLGRTGIQRIASESGRPAVVQEGAEERERE